MGSSFSNAKARSGGSSMASHCRLACDHFAIEDNDRFILYKEDDATRWADALHACLLRILRAMPELRDPVTPSSSNKSDERL
jgi:hypothetical protein